MKEVSCNFCRKTPGKDRERPWDPCRKCEGHRKFLVSEDKTEICGFCGGNGGDPQRPWELCRKCNGNVYISGLIEPPKGIQAFLVQAGRPYDAHKALELIFAELTGNLKICDPYLGDSTLDRLVLMTNAKKIQFLTQKNQSNATKFATFKSQYPNFAFADINKVIHDRYILTFDSIILLGHGIKDIGTKDSFIVSLDNSVAEDLIESTRDIYDSNWSDASAL